MLSKLKKKIEHRLAGSKHKLGKTAADAGGERVDPTGSLPRPGPHGMGSSSHGQGGDGTNIVGGRDTIPSSQLEAKSSPVRGGKSDGMWIESFRLLSLMFFRRHRHLYCS
jgi:hypothetical protein